MIKDATVKRPLLGLIAGLFLSTSFAADPTPVHGIAMHGDLKYPADFTHFDYVNPEAPKGGTVKLADIGTFDNLNPFILKGTAGTGISRTFDTLSVQSSDEAFSEYGLLAESIEMPDDRSWVIFNLNPKARFHDGTQVTAEDGVHTLELFKTKGHPFYRAYYKDVMKAEALSPTTLKFTFADTGNRELPMIMGQMPILSKAFFEKNDFAKTTLDPVLGSGPYKITKVEPGRSITYERVKDYWAADLPVQKGKNNFDVIRYDYYRDSTVALEAFKAGEYDFREENISKNWLSAYDIPAVRDGRVTKTLIRHHRPTGMQGFAMNTRRPQFADPRVREAMSLAFDFEWANKNLFGGAYTRTQSYFSNSELAATGTPSEKELAILEPHRARLPTAVFNKAFIAPSTEGKNGLRLNLRRASKLLKEAGWIVKKGKRINAKTGKPLAFEILLISPSFERIALPYSKNLKRLGIDVKVRVVDTSQYQKRMDTFDFDMVVIAYGQSLSPGNEQRNMWSSKAAKTNGTRNVMGIEDPVVDELVESLIVAEDRDALINLTKALDRVLLWGHYVVPHWHIQAYRVAYWNKFGRPDVIPPYDLGFGGWWVLPDMQSAN